MFLSRLSRITLLSILALAAPLNNIWGACGNGSTTGPSGPGGGGGDDDGNKGDPVNIYTGNEFWQIHDLTLPAAVGQTAFRFTRWGNSRTVSVLYGSSFWRRTLLAA